MALDPTTGNKQKPPATAADFSATELLTGGKKAKPVKPDLRSSDVADGPPHPALQAAGFNKGIQAFNRRVEIITDAYRGWSGGLRPKPGLMFDLVRSPLADDQLPQLFNGLAQTKRQQQASNLVRGAEPRPILSTNKALFNSALNAVRAGTFENWIDENGHEFASALQKNPELASRWVRASAAAREKQTRTTGGSALSSGLPKDYGSTPYIGLAPQDIGTLGLASSKLVGTPATVGAQYFGALVLGAPLLALAEYRGVRKSVEQKSARPFVKAQVEIGKAAYAGVKRDVTNPTENMGFLAADVFGLLTLGAGAASRAGAVGRAEGVAAKAKAAARRQPAGTVEVRKGGMVEQELAFENPLARGIQKVVNDARNRNMDARFTGQKPAGFKAKARTVVLDSPIDVLLPAEGKLGRLTMARLRAEQALADVAARELEHVAKATNAEVTIRQFVAQRTGRLPEQVTSRSLLPSQLRRGLTVGEQKAIQVISLDDETPVQTWRQFHEFMIDAADTPQAVAAHRAQLAALDLAEKAMENPSPRFEKAAALALEVYDQQQRIKLNELGLSPDSAEFRVAAPGEVVRRAIGSVQEGDVPQPLPDPRVIQSQIDRLQAFKASGRADNEAAVQAKIDALVVEKKTIETERAAIKPVTDTGSYSSYRSITRSKAQIKSELRQLVGTREGQFGISVPRRDPTISHAFTGKSILAGDFRIDATNLAVGEYGRVAQLATKLAAWKQMSKAATDIPRNVDDIPIRLNDNEIPTGLREVRSKIETGDMLSQEEAALLDQQALNDLVGFLWPQVKWAGEPIDGIGWVSQGIVPAAARRTATAESSKTVRAAITAGQLLNEPARALTLYARSAYAINILSNAGMLVLQDSLRAGPSLAKSAFAHQIYGGRITRQLDALAGEGKNLSFINQGLEAKALAPGRVAARFWNAVADRWMRRAAVLTELAKKGVKGKNEIGGWLTDAAKTGEHVEVSRRAKKAMVEFDNLTEVEKSVLRNIVFVYPWVSRSAVWSVRTLVEHPIKTDLLAQLGRGEDDNFKSALAESAGPAAEWFTRGGYYPLGWTADGNPKVVNASQLTAFSTLRDMLYLGQGTFVDNVKYSSLADMLGPGAQFAVSAITGRDSYGNEYDMPSVVGAFYDLIQGLPQVQAFQRSQKQDPGLPPFDIADRQTLVKREKAAARQLALSPGWADGYGLLITGSALTAREANALGLAARYWRDQPIEDRQKHELDLIFKVLQEQARYLRRPLPTPVSEAVSAMSAISLRQAQLARTTVGHELTERQKDQVMLDVLHERGNLNDDTYNRLVKQADGRFGEAEHRDLRGKVMDRYAGGAALADWQDDVNAFASFHKRDSFQHQVDVLAGRGLVEPQKVTADQAKLDEYARRFVTFRDKADALDARGATPDEIRAYFDANDNPVNGLPSPVRMAWAAQSNEQQARHLRSAATQSWDTLSTLDKELLGQKVPQGVAQAWATFKAQMTAAAKKAGRGYNAASKLKYAETLDTYYGLGGAFVADYKYAQQPLYRRLATTPVVKDSSTGDRWRQLLNAADSMWRYHTSDPEAYSATAVRKAWRDYVVSPGFQQWLAENPAFSDELKAAGSNSLVEGLLN